MRMEVFEYLCAIDRYGSLSRAAESLYVSQPNLSNVITSLESELGYKVLVRDHQGVRFTEKGRQVLEIARRIAGDRTRLFEIGMDAEKLILNVSIGNNSFLLGALCEMVSKLPAEGNISLHVENLSVDDAMRGIAERSLDLAYIIIQSGRDRLLQEQASRNGLRITLMKEAACQIKVRRGHPLTSGTYRDEDLWNYPFVGYLNSDNDAYGRYKDYINPSRCILVDHYSTRDLVIRNTDAYGIGFPTPAGILRENGMEAIPIPDLRMRLAEVRRQEDTGNALYDTLLARVETSL